MGKECGAWVSRRLWGGGNTSPLKTTAWEASVVYTKTVIHLSVGESGQYLPRCPPLFTSTYCYLLYT